MTELQPQNILGEVERMQGISVASHPIALAHTEVLLSSLPCRPALLFTNHFENCEQSF